MIATKKNQVNADSIGLEHINAMRRKEHIKLKLIKACIQNHAHLASSERVVMRLDCVTENVCACG